MGPQMSQILKTKRDKKYAYITVHSLCIRMDYVHYISILQQIGFE